MARSAWQSRLPRIAGYGVRLRFEYDCSGELAPLVRRIGIARILGWVDWVSLK